MYGGITRQAMCLRSSHARAPFAIAWVTPCSSIAPGTGSSASNTAIRTSPPAMPMAPDRVLVKSTTVQMRRRWIMVIDAV